MKGVLKKINDKWIVEYDQWTKTGQCIGGEVEGYWSKEQLSLHPDDEKDLVSHWYENMEVEFRIDYKTPMRMKRGQEQYSNIMQQTYGTSAKIIDKEEPQENWDEIFQDFEDTNRAQFLQRMKDLYHPPKRIKS